MVGADGVLLAVGVVAVAADVCPELGGVVFARVVLRPSAVLLDVPDGLRVRGGGAVPGWRLEADVLTSAIANPASSAKVIAPTAIHRRREERSGAALGSVALAAAGGAVSAGDGAVAAATDRAGAAGTDAAVAAATGGAGAAGAGAAGATGSASPPRSAATRSTAR